MMNNEQIKHMVNRFLVWKLPEDFNPDAGISFKPVFNEGTAHPMRHEPVGTNLLTATQAEAMVRHMLADLPSTDTYRGWTISQGRWPEPWMATGPNYDAWTDDGSWQDNGEKADAPTREALIVEIDAWFEENEPTARDIIGEHEGLGMPKYARADKIVAALAAAGFQIERTA